jgi:hypothetical protein
MAISVLSFAIIVNNKDLTPFFSLSRKRASEDFLSEALFFQIKN